jgi:hypothetical protein
MEIHALGPGLGKPLRLDRLEALTDRLQAAVRDRKSWRGSLGGMSVSLDRLANLTICREKPRRRGRLEHVPEELNDVSAQNMLQLIDSEHPLREGMGPSDREENALAPRATENSPLSEVLPAAGHD